MVDNKKYNIYLEVKHELLLEDAKNFILDYLADENGLYPEDIEDDIDWDKYDLEYLVSEFEDKEDCNVAFNDTWGTIINRYMEDFEEE